MCLQGSIIYALCLCLDVLVDACCNWRLFFSARTVRRNAGRFARARTEAFEVRSDESQLKRVRAAAPRSLTRVLLCAQTPHPATAMGKKHDEDSSSDDNEDYNNPADAAVEISDEDEESGERKQAASPKKKARAAAAAASSKASPGKKKASYLSTEQDEEDDWNTARNEAAEAAALQAQLSGDKAATKRRRITKLADVEESKKSSSYRTMEGQANECDCTADQRALSNLIAEAVSLTPSLVACCFSPAQTTTMVWTASWRTTWARDLQVTMISACARTKSYWPASVCRRRFNRDPRPKAAPARRASCATMRLAASPQSRSKLQR